MKTEVVKVLVKTVFGDLVDMDEEIYYTGQKLIKELKKLGFRNVGFYHDGRISGEKRMRNKKIEFIYSIQKKWLTVYYIDYSNLSGDIFDEKGIERKEYTQVTPKRLIAILEVM